MSSNNKGGLFNGGCFGGSNDNMIWILIILIIIFCCFCGNKDGDC